MIHVVKQGETLWDLAGKYGVSADRLRSDNGLTMQQPLVPGQALIVLIPSERYIVKSGDTLYQIAEATETSVLELLRNNPTVADTWTVFPGQSLAIRFPEERKSTMTVNGYAYPHINSMVLRRALPFLTYLSVFSYGFQTDGSLIVPPDDVLLAESRRFGVGPVLVLTATDESGTFSSQRARLLFHDIPLQNTVLDRLMEIMEEKGYLGLDMDFEYINPEDADAYFDFLRNAAARLAEHGWFLHTDLAPKTSSGQTGLLYEAHQYPVIGEISNTVLLMTYEWGHAYGPPMAVAPLPQVRQVVDYGVSEIPPEKILMGIPNYGYDWTLPFVQGTRAESLGNQSAVLRAAEYRAEIQFDESAQSPYFEYERAGRQHIVWFEDVRSISAKLELASSRNLAGVSYWNLLRPFAQNWALLHETHWIRTAF